MLATHTASFHVSSRRRRKILFLISFKYQSFADSFCTSWGGTTGKYLRVCCRLSLLITGRICKLCKAKLLRSFIRVGAASQEMRSLVTTVAVYYFCHVLPVLLIARDQQPENSEIRQKRVVRSTHILQAFAPSQQMRNMRGRLVDHNTPAYPLICCWMLYDWAPAMRNSEVAISY